MHVAVVGTGCRGYDTRMGSPLITALNAAPGAADPGVRQAVFDFSFMDSAPVPWKEGTYEPDFVDVAFTPQCSYASKTHVSKSLREFDVGIAHARCTPPLWSEHWRGARLRLACEDHVAHETPPPLITSHFQD